MSKGQKSTTPEFLRWALRMPCDLKDIPAWNNPDYVERHLRAIRIYQTAVREDRVLDGIAVAPLPTDQEKISAALGFRVADVFESFGKPEDVAACCEHCPANVMRLQFPDSSVGCFGILPVTNVDVHPWADSIAEGELDLRKELESALQSHPDLQLRLGKLFLQTKPVWYGIWIPEVPSLEQRRMQSEVMRLLQSQIPDQDFTESWRLFAAALDASIISDIPIEIQLLPAGMRDNVHWTIPAHCRNCHGPVEPVIKMDSYRCQICGIQKQPLPPQRRFVKGKRPYWEINRFLGEQGAATFIDKYVQKKGKQNVSDGQRVR